MSLFRKVGEKFEETKRAVVGGDDTEFVCLSCEKGVDADHEHCPHCGEDAVEPVA